MSAPAGRPHAFLGLLSAAQGIEQEQPDKLARPLAAVPLTDFVRVAARHRCLGYLYRGVLKFNLRSEQSRAFLETLRAHRAKAALQAFATRAQLRAVTRTLGEAGVPFVLLKGAARLFRGDVEADWNTMCDLDILIPQLASDVAVTAFERAGYRRRTGGVETRREHHHLAPLLPPGPGLAIELHHELAPPGTLSTRSDWQACEPYFERVAVDGAEALCFDLLGTALHLTIHGSGVRRLHDLVMLARILRSTPGTHESIRRLIADERIRAVALHGALTLSARIAGIPARTDQVVDRYLDWVLRREALPAFVRDRSQFVDAWYCNGGRAWGPASREALPDYDEPDRAAALVPIWYAGRVLGRLGTSLYAAASSLGQRNIAP
jgi:hypothetical protein